MVRKERWRNYHNDEKVMREVKSIQGEKIRESKSGTGSLRIGGTDPPAYLI